MPVRFNAKLQTWFFRFSRDRRSYFKGGFRTKKQAADAETRKLDHVLKSEACPESAGRDMTFVEAAKWFFDNYSTVRKRSWKNDRGRIKVMGEFFGLKKLGEISASDVARMRVHLKRRGLKDHTVNHYQATLKAIFNRMKKFRVYFGENPVTQVEMEKVPQARTRFLYPNEEAILTPEVEKNPKLWPYYFVALHSGMRIGEICNIRVKDVSLAMGTIFVPNSKSSRSRHIPVSKALSEFLTPLVSSKWQEDFLLGGLSHWLVRKYFKKAYKLAGIQDLVFHDLRHSFAQRLLSKGVPIYKVSRILGHSSVVVTERHYGHLAFSDLKTAVDNIDGVLSRPGCTQVALGLGIRQESLSNRADESVVMPG